MIDLGEEWVAFPHHEGFLRDILEHPFSDTPRLIYADWLEENGDEQGQKFAQFIRTQIELDGMPPVLEWKPYHVSMEFESETLSFLMAVGSVQDMDANILKLFFANKLPLDIVVNTSRVSSLRLEDAVVTYRGVTHSTIDIRMVSRPRPWRPRYNELVTQQHRLLVGGESPLFYDIASIPHVDEDGQPIGPKGRGGMVVYPAREREPYCDFSPRIRQHFRRGFVWKVTLRTQEVDKYLPMLLMRHPITFVEISDLMVNPRILSDLTFLHISSMNALGLDESQLRWGNEEDILLQVSNLLLRRYRRHPDVFARNSQKAV